MANTEQKIVKLVDRDIHTRGASVETIGSKGALVVSLGGADSENLPGVQVPSADSIVATYPDANTEVYTYKVGGVSGTTVAVVTVVYTGGVLTSVVKTLP